jgi:hypothetical protein
VLFACELQAMSGVRFRVAMVPTDDFATAGNCHLTIHFTPAQRLNGQAHARFH